MVPAASSRRDRRQRRSRLRLSFCPSPCAYLLGAPGAAAPVCIAVSPGACSAVVLAMNAWSGRFGREHARRLLSEPAHARFATELAPLLAALERAPAVHVVFFLSGAAVSVLRSGALTAP